MDALVQGDEEKARRLATQAALRPFDDHEGVWPGPWAAHYALFELVTDEIEEWPEGDHSWIDALASVISQASGRQLDELRHLAAVLDQDARVLGVDDLEAHRVRALADGSDPSREPSEEVSEGERSAYVLDLARVLLAVETRLQAGRAGDP